MRVTDPRQQLLAPVVQRPTTAPTPRPTPIEFNPNNINLAALNNIDTGSFDLANLGLFAPTPTVAPAPRPAPAPPAPSTTNRFVDPVSAFTPPPAPVVAPTPTPVAPPTPPPVSRIVDPVSVITPPPPPPAPVAPPAPPVAPVPRIVDPVSAFTPTPVPTPQSKPPTPVAPPAPPVEPVDVIVDPVDAFDTGSVSIPAVADIDTGGFDLTDLGLFQEGGLADDVFSGLDITLRDEVNPNAWVDVFNDYSNFLGSVESGNTDNKVNRRDDIYNNYYNENTTANQYLGDPSAFRAAVGLSDAFSVYDTAGSTVTGDSLQGAYQALTSGANPAEALSAYYGFEIQPTSNEGANYTNAAKYGTDAQRMAEFQSLVEPILQKAIPYIQATQGLSYTDALEYAYTHDPMLNALYQSYGVDLFRQTDDGSTYIYDPIAGQEIRTLEVKDAKFKDYLEAALKIAVTTVATAGIGSAVAAGLGAAGLPANIANTVADIVVSAARSGGDIKQGIVSALTGSGELRTVTDYFPEGLEGMVNVARSVYDAANTAIDPEVDTTVDITIDPDQDEEVVIDDDGNISINVLPPAVDEPEDGGGGGGGGDTTEGGEAVDDSGAVEDSEVVDDSGAVDDTPPPITTDGIFDPQMPWIYQGNGVFVHGETGETVTEDVSDYDPYVVGETYGRGTDDPLSPEDADEGEDDLLGTDIFGSTIDPDTTITPEVVIEPTPPTPATPPTPPADTVDVIVDPEDAFGGGATPLPPEVVVEPTPPMPPQPPALPTDGVDVIIDPEDAFGGDDEIVVDDGGDGIDDGGGDDDGVDDTGGTDGGTDTGEGDGDGSGTGGGTGTGDGTGAGDGAGDGDGSGEGDGDGRGTGIGSGMLGRGSKPITPESFMASISFAPELLTPYMPQNSRDYLAELLARLQK